MSKLEKKNPQKIKSRKALGRGLNSLLSTNDFTFDKASLLKEEKKVTSSKAYNGVPFSGLNNKKTNENKYLEDKKALLQVPLEKIFTNPNQPRKSFSKQSLEELCLSIKEQGLLQPITVRRVKDRYEIIAGERRFRASQMAGLGKIPIIVKNHVDQRKSMELALIENLQREDLNILEEAFGYQTLMDDYQLSQKELALKLGKNRSSIANVLRVLVLPGDVKEKLKQGSLSFGHGKVLLSLDSPRIQSQLARKAVHKDWSIRQLEKEVKKLGTKKEGTKVQPTVSAEHWINELRIKMEKILGTKVGIQYKKGRGQINVSFYSDEELARFYEKIRVN